VVDGVSDGLALHPDDTNSRVLWSTIVNTIAEITNPGLQIRGIVLLDCGAVGDDLAGTGDRGPLSARVDESNVDVAVRIDVIGLARLGVGMEDEVNAAVLLFWQVLVSVYRIG